MLLEKFDLLIQDFTSAISKNPNDFCSYIARGRAYYQKQEYDKAIKDYLSATNSDIEYTKADAYTYLGKTHYFLKDYNQAILYYTKAIEIFKTNLYYDSLIKCYKNGVRYIYFLKKKKKLIRT